MFNALAENLDELAGNHWAMVAFPTENIEAGAHAVLSRDRAIIRLIGDPADSLLQRSAATLSTQGYRIAVSPTGNEYAMPDSAQIVHFDLAQSDRQLIRQRIAASRRENCRVMVSAIEERADFEMCKAAGVDLFEGRFFCAPSPGGSRDLPLTRTPTMRLLSALQNPDIRLQDLEDLVRDNLALSYKLLNFANSTYVGLSRPVESLRHAVGLVGIERIRRWASLLLYSTVEEKPRELFVTAAIRARMCERLADSDDEWRESVFFTVGLLSVLDGVFDAPMEEAIESLPLSAEIREALILGTGILGSTLQAVLDYENGNFESLYLRPFHQSLVRNAYFDALLWARNVSNGLMI